MACAGLRSPFVVWPDLLRPRFVREVTACEVLHAINFTSFGAVAWLLIGRPYRRPLVLTTFYHPPPATRRAALGALYDRTAGRLNASAARASASRAGAATRRTPIFKRDCSGAYSPQRGS